jgi:general secretion pathway protein K
MPAAGRRNHGFALLMVLWTLTLLAFIATVFGSNARTEVLLARNLVSNARAEALADAGVFRAAAGLSLWPSEGGFKVDGQVYIWRPSSGDGGDVTDIDGAEVRFTIRDEGGKIDLNQSNAVLLRELFIVVGVDPDLAEELADAVVDFRDDDQEKEPHGAEAREYKQAGLAWGPKNGPFNFVDELIYVHGMSPEIYRRVAPMLTVWGTGETPHSYTAPPEVLQALASALKAPRRRPSAGKQNEADAASIDSSRSAFSRSERSLGSTGSAFGNTRSGLESRSGSGSAFGSGSRTNSAGGGSLFDRSRSSFESGGSGSGGFASKFGSSAGSGFSNRGASETLSGDTAGAEPDLERQERSGGSVFTVHAEARTEDGAVFVREATVDMNASENVPLSIRAWRQGNRVLFPENRGVAGSAG